ncbi:MAG TPA: HD domain-containing protein [Roseiflexaceae bacterium]|nr:HD domain-containing protein [Roseiflexaceae bacterium]
MHQPNFQRARAYALQRLERELPAALTYHSLGHTRDDVAPATVQLAAIAGIYGEQRMLLHTAAYYHDIGFVIQRTDHEAIGAQIAAEALPSFGYTAPQIEIIHDMIMATRLPQSPRNLLEQLIADADLDALGRSDFLARNQALRDELAAYGERWNDLEWYREQLAFLSSHRYWTDAAQRVRGEQKRRNVETIVELIERCQVHI